MSQVAGYFFDGKSSHPKNARLSVGAGNLKLEFDDASSRTFRRDQVFSCPVPSQAVLSIDFEDGSKFEAFSQSMEPDVASLDRSPQRGWERHWRFCAAGLGAIFIFIVAFYWVFFPSVARRLAEVMPDSISRQVSRDFDQLVAKFTGEQKPEFYEKLKSAAEPIFKANPELHADFKICCTAGFMANAFALPNGEIVATQQLVTELSPDELTAVLLHEIGHVHFHHPMQVLIEDKFISATVMLLAGYGEAYGWGGMILSMANSRDAEREADLFAGEALKRLGKSPKLLGEALDHIERLSNMNAATARLGWLSTHPITAERKKYLESL